MKKLIIIGSGFGGISLLLNLKKFCKNNKNLEILLISKTNHFLFTPLLHEAIIDEVSIDNISYSIKELSKEIKNFSFIQDEVENIDFDNKTVFTYQNEYQYDYLVVSVGSEANFYENTQFKDKVFTLKSIKDYEKIKNKLEENKTKNLDIVVVGGGSTGVEIIGSLSDVTPKNINLYLFELSDNILNELNNKELSNIAIEKINQKGINIKLLHEIKEINDNSIVSYDKQKDEYLYINTDFIIWTAGIKPSRLINKFDLKKDKKGRVLVDSYLNIPNDPNVFFMGDCAKVDSDEEEYTTAQNAVQQADIVAHNIYAKINFFSFSKKFKYIHQGSLISIGKGFAISDLYGVIFTGYSGWFIWKAIHLVKLINNKNRKDVLFDWIKSFG